MIEGEYTNNVPNVLLGLWQTVRDMASVLAGSGKNVPFHRKCPTNGICSCTNLHLAMLNVRSVVLITIRDFLRRTRWDSKSSEIVLASSMLAPVKSRIGWRIMRIKQTKYFMFQAHFATQTAFVSIAKRYGESQKEISSDLLAQSPLAKTMTWHRRPRYS